jgi:hypothetical protein
MKLMLVDRRFFCFVWRFALTAVMVVACQGEWPFQPPPRLATQVQGQPVLISVVEKRPDGQSDPLAETPRLDPSSAQYLARVTPQRKEIAKTTSGATLRLMNQLSIAEAPDYDPFEDLGKIKVAWRQIAGPKVEILDANSSRARALMPHVVAPTVLVFVLEASNASGTRGVELTVTVNPQDKR